MRHPIDIDYVTKAIVGIASPVLGVITSLQEQIGGRRAAELQLQGLSGTAPWLQGICFLR